MLTLDLASMHNVIIKNQISLYSRDSCYNLEENIICKDDYDFYCVACKPHPELTLSIPATTNTKTNNLSTLLRITLLQPLKQSSEEFPRWRQI